MKAAHEASEDRPNICIKAEEVSDITFVRGSSPSLLARRTWNLLIQAAAGDGWQDGKLHSIKKRDLCAGWHVGPQEIAETLEELQTTLIRRHTTSPNGKAARVTTALLSSTIEETDNDDSSIVYFRFTPEVAGMLRTSQHYVELERLVYLAFECKYSHPLYERGVRIVRNKRFTETLKLEELRAIFGVPKGKLPRWDAIKRFVVEPAVAEVNLLCPAFTVQWQPIQDKTTKRHNPAVTAVQFVYVPNSETKEKAARKELTGSKVGRKARMAGTVEALTDERRAERTAIEADLKAMETKR